MYLALTNHMCWNRHSMLFIFVEFVDSCMLPSSLAHSPFYWGHFLWIYQRPSFAIWQNCSGLTLMMDLFRCWLIKVDLIVDGIFLSIAEKNFYPLLFLARRCVLSFTFSRTLRWVYLIVLRIFQLDMRNLNFISIKNLERYLLCI